MAREDRMTEESQKRYIDWETIEKHYRAGFRSLRDIGNDHGITEAAIRKRAKRDGWTRNLEEKIQQKAQEKVRKELLRTNSSQLSNSTEKLIVEEFSDVVSIVDLKQRKDVECALDISRTLMGELMLLSEPSFGRMLAELGEEFDQGTPARPDKKLLLYNYIISLEGRLKMLKELAAAHGTYIPIQRKIFKLDSQEEKKDSTYEAVIAMVNQMSMQ